MYRENLEVVSKSELVKRLEESLDFMTLGGTSYRIETARLSLEIVMNLGDFNILNSRKNVKMFVQATIPNIDEERCEDISENIFHHYRDLYLKKNLADDIQAELRRRKKKREVTLSYMMSN